MEIEAIAISAFITIFSFGLLLVSLASYNRYKKFRLLSVSIVFLVFLIKGILLSLGLIYDIPDILTNVVYIGLFDLIILVLLFMTTLRR